MFQYTIFKKIIEILKNVIIENIPKNEKINEVEENLFSEFLLFCTDFILFQVLSLEKFDSSKKEVIKKK